MIITLCGSLKFKDEFIQKNKELSLAGHIVLTPVFFENNDGSNLPIDKKLRLENVHKLKIDMSDEIYVINKDGYIGESTYSEIDWANKKNKKIEFLVPIETPEERKNRNSEDN